MPPMPAAATASFRTFFCFLILSLLVLAFPAYAQTSVAGVNPVSGLLQDEIQLMIGQKESRYTKQEGTNPLEIRFCDVKTTKDYCNTPSRLLNQSGSSPTSGIKLEPAIEGEWRWQSDYTLVFTPKKTWPANQTYTVSFDPTLFPPFVKLNTTSWAFSSEPLRATVSSMTFFQDPNDVSKKLVSTNIGFNFPVVAETAEKNIVFEVEEGEGASIVKKPGTLAFKPEWNSDKTNVSITTPIGKLGENEQFVRVTVGAGVSPVHGGENVKLTEGKPTERVLIPSVYSYVTINSTQTTVVKNAKFEPEQIIVVQINAPTSQEELKKSLSIQLLPKDKAPPVAGQSAKKDYAWSSPTEVTPDVLKDAPQVPFTLSPIGTSEATTHMIKFSAEPNRWVYLSIKKGMKTYGDFILGNNYENTLQAPSFGKEVKILPEEGSILSLSGDKKITLFSLGATKLEVEMGRILPDAVNQMIGQSYGSFSNPSLNYNFSVDTISERIVREIPLPNAAASKPQFSAFDFSEYIGAKPMNKGMFFFTVRAMEKDASGNFVKTAEDSRFILVTDLGFLVKKNHDGTQEVFVQSLEDGSSVYNATVEVLGKNGLPVTSTSTNWTGHAIIPNLKGLERDKEPVAFLVRRGRDVSFMPFERYDRSLNYSRFETGGQRSVENGLRAYLFSDRGIYRPGEEIHLGMTVKQADWTTNLDGLPLMLEIMNPRGQYTVQKTVTLNAEGFIEYSFSTKDTSPTGNYQVRLSLAENGKAGTHIGSTNVRVEEFQPDTMKITSRFNKPDTAGWVSPKDLEASINLMNLYGTPAAGNVVKANINLAPKGFAFKEYKDFSFYDSKSANKTFDQPLNETKTDDKGDAVFPLDLSTYGDSTYRLTFYAEGFEEGSGKSVKTAKSILVSPLSYILGYKADGPLDYISQNSQRIVNIIAVNPALEKTTVENVTLEKVGVTYIDSLVQSGSTYSYQSIPKETVIESSSLQLPVSGLFKPLDTDKAGNFILRLKNAEGLVISQVNYSVVGDITQAGGSKKDNIIDVKLNKTSYEPGEEMELSITAPYTGSGLITLETDRVLTYQWFKAETTSSLQHITIPSDFAGKGFVNVQFIRGRDSKEVFTNPLSIGVAPFMVGTDALDTKISLTVPETIKPGQTLPISFFTKHPSKIVIFAIDEGILQYGQYKTPDPLKFLVGNRALQVDTYQILDQLLPEYSVLQSMAAFGGDMALNDGKNLNPFKRKSLPPVAYWSGIIDADKNVKEVSYTVPEHFNGSLRVMAVAVSNSAVGATEQKTTVRGDLIVGPNAPLFVAPDDVFEVTTSVANNLKGSGNNAKISFDVSPSDALEIIEGKTQTLTIAEGKEGTAKIRVKAKNILGNASLTFTASSGEGTAKIEATMSVRPPVASSTQLLSGYLEKGEKTLALVRKIYPQFAEAGVSVSGLPLSLVPGLVKYLEKFPYGCSEQLISQTFPNLVLHDDPDFQATFKDAPETIRSTLSTILERQSQDGGIGLWWSGDASDSFVSIYALHYMTVAKEKNLPVPVNLMNNTIAYVRQLVNRSVVSLPQARQAAYGIYLLTRNGEVTSNYLPYLLQYLEQNQKEVWKNDITAMYIAATYKMMQLEPEAKALVKGFDLGEPRYWSTIGTNTDVFYDDLIRHSLYLYLISEHFPDELKTMDKKVLFRVANFIGEGSYNTIASSYAIMGISAYGKAQAAALSGVTITPSGTTAPVALSGQKILKADFDSSVSALDVNSPVDGLFYQVATTGFDSVLPQTPSYNGIEVTRSYEDAEGNPITQVKLGDTVYVKLTLRSYNNLPAENIAIVDLFPGGFEPVVESLRNASTEPNPDEEGQDAVAKPSTLDSRNTWVSTAVDVREDRAILIGTLNPDPQIFIYKIKAVNPGSYMIPPAFAESMYQRAISSKGTASHIEVTTDDTIADKAP